MIAGRRSIGRMRYAELLREATPIPFKPNGADRDREIQPEDGAGQASGSDEAGVDEGRS